MNRHIWYSPMKDSDLIATESGSEWNLNPRPLNSVQVCQSTELSGHELNSHSEPTLYSYSNFISSFSVYLWFWPLPWSVATFAWSESRTGIHMSAAEWTDTYCIHHWRILRSSYRNLVWVGFEPASEFPSDALTDWAIRPCAQLALRAIFVQLQLHLFVQCFHFISDIAFVSSQIYFKRNLAQVFT